MKKNSGITLIEVLIAILIFSTSILGVAAMQASSLKISNNSGSLSVAVFQASNMVDRMLANPQGIDDGDYNAISGAGSDPACGTDCTPAQIASLDHYEWNQDNADLLVNGSGTVTSTGSSGLFTITINWTERGKESDEAKSYQLTFLPYQP